MLSNGTLIQGHIVFFQFHGKTVKAVSGKSFQAIAICLDKLHTHTQSHITKLVFIYIHSRKIREYMYRRYGIGTGRVLARETI